MKIHEHDAGYMAKMATMPMYVKNFQKSFSPEPVDQFPRNLVSNPS